MRRNNKWFNPAKGAPLSLPMKHCRRSSQAQQHFLGGSRKPNRIFRGIPGTKLGGFRGVPGGSGGFRGNNAYSVLQKALYKLVQVGTMARDSSGRAAPPYNTKESFWSLPRKCASACVDKGRDKWRCVIFLEFYVAGLVTVYADDLLCLISAHMLSWV